MKFTTFIPIRRNDGSPVSEAEIDEIHKLLWGHFGGLTAEGVVNGHWIDSHDGQHYQDESLKISVACNREQLHEAEQIVREIGRRLGQKAMYFEVQYYDGVQFLRTDG